MLSLALRPIRQFAQAVITSDSPRQIAVGFVLGMMFGLVPKGNLSALVLIVLLLALRVNKPAGLVGIAAFTWLGAFCDGFAHLLGSAVLVWQPLRGMHDALYVSAVSPLFGWNNTVVVGQLALGLYLAFPVYWTVYHVAAKVQPPLGEWLMRYKVVR